MADNDSVLETWEMLTESTVWVWLKDQRTGSMVKKRVGGTTGGSRVLHISSDERRFNQEQVIDENSGTDPFTNGSMKLRDTTAPEDVDSRYHLTAADLRELLSIRDLDLFEAEVSGITSELILRRLKDIAENEATIAQYTFVRDLVDNRYRTGGTQATVREMLEDEAKRSGNTLSS